MTEDEKAAEAWANDNADSPCLDCAVSPYRNSIAAFLAGVEHARKNPLKTRTEAEELESKLGRRVTI